MDALAHKEPCRARFATHVRFTENDVELPVGSGLWGSVSSVAKTSLEVADADTGNAAWFGTVEENGAPAYYAMRLKVEEGRDRRGRDRRGPEYGSAGTVRRSTATRARSGFCGGSDSRGAPPAESG